MNNPDTNHRELRAAGRVLASRFVGTALALFLISSAIVVARAYEMRDWLSDRRTFY